MDDCESTQTLVMISTLKTQTGSLEIVSLQNFARIQKPHHGAQRAAKAAELSG